MIVVLVTFQVFNLGIFQRVSAKKVFKIIMQITAATNKTISKVVGFGESLSEGVDCFDISFVSFFVEFRCFCLPFVFTDKPHNNPERQYKAYNQVDSQVFHWQTGAVVIITIGKPVTLLSSLSTG